MSSPHSPTTETDEVRTVRATLPLPGADGRPRELRLRRYSCIEHPGSPRPCRGQRTADGCGPCWVSDARIMVAEGDGEEVKLHRRAVIVADADLRDRIRFGAFPVRPGDLASRGSRPIRIVNWWGAVLVPPERIGHPRLDDPDWVRRPPRPPLPPLAPGSRGTLPEGYSLAALEETDDVPITPALARRRSFRMVARDGDGALCARADAYWTFEGELMVSDIWVDPAHRRRGLATAMYCAIERLARMTLTPYPEQSEDGRALWDQPDRPFGVGPEGAPR